MQAFSAQVQAQTVHAAERREWTGQLCSVLCIGQDPATCEVMQHVLAGHDLVFASNANEALRRLNSRPFDLYVLEYWLPDWAGASLCRDIRKVDPHVPVCFCTTAARPGDRQRAERAGASAYVVKPVDQQLLEAELSMLMVSLAARNDSARQAARSTLRQELEKRFAAVDDAMHFQQFEAALKRTAHRAVRAAFLANRGTLAAFDAAWETLWREAWSTRLQ